MTFAEAMEQSWNLEFAAWRAVALRLPEKDQREAIKKEKEQRKLQKKDEPKIKRRGNAYGVPDGKPKKRGRPRKDGK